MSGCRMPIGTPGLLVFNSVVALVLEAEGVFSDDACDSGGATKFGHDTASWPYLLARLPPDVRAVMPENVCDLNKVLAIAAYYWGYWVYYRCDTLPAPFGLLLFDVYVNGGHGVVWLQRALGVNPDGQFGPITLAAAKRAASGPLLRATIVEFQSWHIAYLISLSSKWPVFGSTNGTPKGWTRRAFTMAVEAMLLAGLPIA